MNLAFCSKLSAYYWRVKLARGVSKAEHIYKSSVLLALAFVSIVLCSTLSANADTCELVVIGFHDVTDPINQPNRLPRPSDYTLAQMSELIQIMAESTDRFDVYDTERLVRQIDAVGRGASCPAKPGVVPLMFSFDDGYAGIYDNLLPLLKRVEALYGVKIRVVLFVNPGLIGTNNQDLRYMTCDQLREGYEAGFFDVQSHGMDHRNLTDLQDDELMKELIDAQTSLNSCIGSSRVANHLAYPYGAADPRVLDAVSQVYKLGFLYDDALLDLMKAHQNKLQLNRVQGFAGRQPLQLMKLILGAKRPAN